MPTYTTLSDIKRIVRSSNEKVIRFSDSLTEVTVKDKKNNFNDDFEFDRNEVTLDSAFQGNRVLEFRFTDPTTFDVVDVPSNINNDILLDQNESISSDYTTPNGLITVKSSSWGGTIEKDDEVRLKFDAHISDNNAEKYIEDAEVEIDSQLGKHRVDFIDDGNNRVFPTASDVPNEISVATAYLAAYYIYTDVYLSIYKEDGGLSSYSKRWFKRAEKYVMNYMDSQLNDVPDAVAFPKFIDRMGVENQYPGLGEMEDKFKNFDRDAKTKEIFTTDYDVIDSWDEI